MQGMKKMTAIWIVFPLDLFTFPKNFEFEKFSRFFFYFNHRIHTDDSLNKKSVMQFLPFPGV